MVAQLKRTVLQSFKQTPGIRFLYYKRLYLYDGPSSHCYFATFEATPAVVISPHHPNTTACDRPLLVIMSGQLLKEPINNGVSGLITTSDTPKRVRRVKTGCITCR
mgnify:CR=1 FL=1